MSQRERRITPLSESGRKLALRAADRQDWPELVHVICDRCRRRIAEVLDVDGRLFFHGHSEDPVASRMKQFARLIDERLRRPRRATPGASVFAVVEDLQRPGISDELDLYCLKHGHRIASLADLLTEAANATDRKPRIVVAVR